MNIHDASWEKVIQIRDPLYGYIPVPYPLVKNIIDTAEFQRLKDIEQTGMRVLYPSATHDRFTHSLGVYYLGRKAFDNFSNNMKAIRYSETSSYYDQLSRNDKIMQNAKLSSKQMWGKWRLLFGIACLLHDCGHAPFSHTLEFIYDLDVEESAVSYNFRDPRNIYNIRRLCQFFGENNSRYIADLILIGSDGKVHDKVKSKPHERMSACFIVTKPFVSIIYQLIQSYMDQIFKVKNYYYDSIEKIADPPDENIYSFNPEFADDIEFICRMITGNQYDYSHVYDYKYNYKTDLVKWKFELQMRNCIIQMLNSSLDIDNIDYAMRDANSSGYENQQIDFERLLSAFTIVSATDYCNHNFAEPIQINHPVLCKSLVNKTGNLSGNFENALIDVWIVGKCKLQVPVQNGKTGQIYIKSDSPESSTNPKPFGEGECNNYNADERFSGHVKSSFIEITGGNNSPEGASIYIRGKICGNFTGLIFGDFEDSSSPKSSREKLFFFAYNKSCLSVLQSAISARNYESEWIYAHHTVCYQTNYLLIYLIDRYSTYKQAEGLAQKIEEIGESYIHTFQCVIQKQKNEKYDIQRRELMKYAREMAKYCGIWLSPTLINDMSFDRCIKYVHDISQSSGDFLLESSNKNHFYNDDSSTNAKIGNRIVDVWEIITRILNSREVVLSEDGFALLKLCIDEFAAIITAYSEKTKNCAPKICELFTKLSVFLERNYLTENVAQVETAISETDSQNFKNFREEIYENIRFIQNLPLSFMIGCMASNKPEAICNHLSFRSTDHRLISDYQDCFLELQKCSYNTSVIRNHPFDSEFYLVLEEYFSRRFPRCAWKTYAEYLHHFNFWSTKEKDELSEILKRNDLPNPDDDRGKFLVLSESWLSANHKVNRRKKQCQEIYELLKCYGISRSVWILCDIKMKKFPPNKTFIRFMNDSVLRLEDISNRTKEKPDKKSFVYMYYYRDNGEALNSKEVYIIVDKLWKIVQKSINEYEEEGC